MPKQKMNKLFAIILCVTSLCSTSVGERNFVKNAELNNEKIPDPSRDVRLDVLADRIEILPICDCGENSVSCKFVEEHKVCTCKPGYAPREYGRCVETCNENNTCANGGSCIQHECICLPGTRGPFCRIIDDCEKKEKLCAENNVTSCEYDTERQKAYCRCHEPEHRFDDATRSCKKCQCANRNVNAWSYCEYLRGEKVCTCRENYAYDLIEKICSTCNCGENSKWCEFNKNGVRVCGCKDGYSQHENKCEKCDCGKHGLCRFSESLFNNMYCICDAGYEEYNRTCVESSCGKYGKCVFDNKWKKVGCQCVTGYAEKSGKCEMCYCGDNSNCTFKGNRKICECSVGYEDVNGFCTDINECKKHNPCKTSMKCINTVGSYRCECGEGYNSSVLGFIGEPLILTCDDINECEDPNACFQPNAECLNTLGSFACVCKSGFDSRGGTDLNIVCEKTSNNAIYALVITTTFIAVITAVGFAFYIKKYLHSEVRGSTLHEMH